MRMSGNEVLMVSGTDEFGTPIQVQAEQEGGLTAKELANKYNRVIVEDLHGLGLSYDLFTRTTTKNHERVTQDMFTALYNNGYVVAKKGMGAVSPSTGRTLPDRYIEGTCPICGYDGARGDQCDNCGNQLDPIELKNPRSRINGGRPPPSSWRPNTSTWTCRRWPTRSAAGSTPGPTGVRTYSNSPRIC